MKEGQNRTEQKRNTNADLLLAKSLEKLVLVHGDGRHGEIGGSMPQTPVAVVCIEATALIAVDCRQGGGEVMWDVVNVLEIMAG